MTYGWETTTDELLEGKHLSGQRILITGGSAGLGAETARALAAHGANLVIAVRELAKGERAAEPIRAGAPPNASVELIELDLASLASVRAFRRAARPASTRAGRPRVRGPPGRHPDRAGAPFNPGDVAAPHATLPYARATQVQVGAAGRGDVRLGRRCR